MSCFGKICRKKKQKFPSIEETEDILLKQLDDLENKIAECTTIAKTNAIINKRVAMRALQKKKRLEKNLEQVDSTLTTLEMQRDAIENAKFNAAILGSIKKAGIKLKKANIKLDPYKVQNVMEDITDQHYISNEISTTIRKSLIVDVDEDDLTRELQQLEVEAIIEQRPVENKCIPEYPSIPSELDDSVFPKERETSINEDQRPSAIEVEVNVIKHPSN